MLLSRSDSFRGSESHFFYNLCFENKFDRLIFVGICFCCFAVTLANANAQESVSPTVNEQARRLFQEAAQALNLGKPDQVMEKAVQVAQLLPDDARVQQRTAELLYRCGSVLESLKYFDRSVELNAAGADENWQRGIALATAGQYEKGAAQFADHHRVNPDDVENSAWHFLCLSKSQGVDSARRGLLPSRGDSRQPMMAILAMLRQEKSPEELQSDLQSLSLDAQQLQTARFYAYLYLGLYYDSQGKMNEAKDFLQKSVECKIAGYMADVARVYLQHRFNDSDNNAGNTSP